MIGIGLGITARRSGPAGPTYGVTPDVNSVNEGGTVTFSVATTGVADATTLYWTALQVSGTIAAGDFTGGALSGSFVIAANAGSVARVLAADASTEGAESFKLEIRTGSTAGPVVATSSAVTINDTSLTATYTALNPADKGANITLSGGDLIATSSGGAGLARTVKAIGAAEHKYWEGTVGAITVNGMFGVSNGSLANTSYPGTTLNGMGWFPSGTVLFNGGAIGSGAGTYTTGDVLGFEVNRSTGLVTLYKNGAQVFTATALGTYDPASVYPTPGAAAGVNVFTMNFGPTMAYSIPAGASLLTA
jgi:hypothetical protein